MKGNLCKEKQEDEIKDRDYFSIDDKSYSSLNYSDVDSLYTYMNYSKEVEKQKKSSQISENMNNILNKNKISCINNQLNANKNINNIILNSGNTINIKKDFKFNNEKQFMENNNQNKNLNNFLNSDIKYINDISNYNTDSYMDIPNFYKKYFNELESH